MAQDNHEVPALKTDKTGFGYCQFFVNSGVQPPLLVLISISTDPRKR